MILPARMPVVIEILREPITPCPDWHRTELSDSHVVRSHAVPPARIAPVNVATPRFAPWTVMLADPVAALFARRTTLSMPMSMENETLWLPTLRPTVSDICRDPPTLLPTLHLIDESDSQVVRSHAVSPTLIEPV